MRLGFAHYNLNIYGMTSRTELCCIHVGFQGMRMKIKVFGLQTHIKLTTATTIVTYPKILLENRPINQEPKSKPASRFASVR